MTTIINNPNKKRNSIDNYFYNIDWKKASVFEIFNYVKMMKYPMILEACVYFNNIWQKHFKNEKKDFKEKIQCAAKLQYLLDEAVLRRSKRMGLKKEELKRRYKRLRQDLDWFLMDQYKIIGYQNGHRSKKNK